jgi:hypothetical protein
LLSSPTKAVLALTAAAAIAACATSAGAQAQEPAPAGPLVYEGPSGRVPLRVWTLRRDPRDRGLHLGYQRGQFSGTPVSVPNVVDPTPYAGHGGSVNYNGSLAWYRTTFTAPAAGVYALGFQSANYRAQVWLDGRYMGSHRGSYLPFEARTRLAAGSHTVVVRVDWRFPARQTREGFHRTWFNWGGLDGEVTVRPIGASELIEPAIATTLPAHSPPAGPARVRVSVYVRNDGTRRKITPTGTLTRGTQVIPLTFPTVTVAHGKAARDTVAVNIAEPALWSVRHPNLYELSLSVPGESSYVARVGLRQLSWHGGHVYLNGELLRLHGASMQQDAQGHGDALSAADEARIVSELKQINANSVRTQHALDPALLERLDAAGILVWQEIGPVEGAGSWHSTTPQLLAEAEQQARVAARAAVLHPSIFAWNLCDEIARNGKDADEVRYVQATARWLHAFDPTRMVAVDIWGDHPPRTPGTLYNGIDAIAETDYSGWYDSPRASPAQLRAEIRSRLAAMARAFPGRVLVVSEFGAESNLLNPGGAPGSYSFQTRLLAAHISVYGADSRLSGMYVWLLRDYPLNPSFSGGSIHRLLPHIKLLEGLNQKGLFTYGGSPKPAAAVVARMYAALGGR